MQIKSNYDLVVIGGGPAGTPVAIEYAKLNHDKKIALIDVLGELGGECLFQGCIPSKILQASAKYIKELDKLKSFGIEIEDTHYKLIWDKIKQRKDAILHKRTTSAKDLAQSIGNIDLIKGHASFIDEKTIEIEQNSETIIIEFQKALIATGSKAFKPQFGGDAKDEVITNEDFFHDMELPNDLSIIGGGAIAIEFAMILSALGVKINLFVRGDKILKNIDEEASMYILEVLKSDKNVNIYFNSSIQEINHKNDMLEITFTQENQTKKILTSKLLSAAGRVPNIKSLNLQNANVEYSKKGIKTTPALQTTNKNIFANGDVVENFPKFAHTAQYTAHLLAQNLFLEHNFFKPDLEKNSWVLFSMPNVAMAGLGQKEAKEKGYEIIVDKFDFSTEAKSQIQEEDFGYLKFIVDKKSYQILGISIMHQEASHIAGEAALIVAKKLTLKDLIDSIHPHPTISESFVMLAKKMMGDIMLKKLDKPIVKALLKFERLI
jgi:dihydrolipoamide dehydrogenase